MKLLNCPHCNGPAYLYQNYSQKYDMYFVFAKCELCNATGKSYRSKSAPSDEEWNNTACKDAAAAWNMRNGKQYHEVQN